MTRSMTLQEWMDTKSAADLAAVAREHGFSPARFYEAAQRPVATLAHARKLSRATAGAVSVVELMGLSREDMPRRRGAA